MQAFFYEKDEEVQTVDGKTEVRPNVLHFFLERPSAADKNAVPFIFDGHATEQHKARYPREWQEFLAKKAAAVAAAPESVAVPVAELPESTEAPASQSVEEATEVAPEAQN